MQLPELRGTPKQVQWAARIRAERLTVWSASSPERFRDIAERVAAITDAGWWISYRDKDCVTVHNHLREGVDLRKLQRDEWLKEEKTRERKDRAEVRSYLKEELRRETAGKNGAATVSTRPVVLDGGLMKWEGPAVDTRSGSVSNDPDLPF